MWILCSYKKTAPKHFVLVNVLWILYWICNITIAGPHTETFWDHECTSTLPKNIGTLLVTALRHGVSAHENVGMLNYAYHTRNGILNPPLTQSRWRSAAPWPQTMQHGIFFHWLPHKFTFQNVIVVAYHEDTTLQVILRSNYQTVLYLLGLYFQANIPLNRK